VPSSGHAREGKRVVRERPCLCRSGASSPDSSATFAVPDAAHRALVELVEEHAVQLRASTNSMEVTVGRR
jgi:hypothetical protein